MAGDGADMEQRSVQLRQELKVWEKSFSKDHDRKAGRDDIKANATIAAKYKEYNRLRKAISSEVAAGTPSKPRRKRKLEDNVTLTPPKRLKSPSATSIKSQDRKAEEELAPADLATPIVKKTMMGPTPQRDGKILGIFDLLPDETPGKIRAIFGSIHTNVMRTPSKPDGELKDSVLVEERARGSRTPASTGKRFLLDSFVTPRKHKLGEERTPSSSRKLFGTPAFLRRDTFALSTVAEEPQSPEIARPWQRRTFGRSLSGMIKELRKQEDEQGDDEWDAIREMEDAEASFKLSTPKLIVEDIQRAVVLDAEGFVPSEVEETEEEAEPQLDRNGQPRKAWKKKGLKRQTRRVIMRPVATKAEQEAPLQIQYENEHETPEPIPAARTSSHADYHEERGKVDDDEAGSNYDAPSNIDDPEQLVTSKSPKASPKRKSTTAKIEVAQTAKKATKRSKPEAHANYRKLKIRGAKGAANKPKGRFGRNKH